MLFIFANTIILLLYFTYVVYFCFKDPVFTHIQLYIALSRVQSKKNGLKLLVLDKDGTSKQSLYHYELTEKTSIFIIFFIILNN